MRKTLWNMGDYSLYPQLRGRMKADVAVIGAGLSGLTVARHLSKAGLKVAVVEARTPGSGSTQVCTGMVNLLDRVLFASLMRRMGLSASDAYARTQMSALRSIQQTAEEAGAYWEEVTAQLIGRNADEHLLLQEEANTMKNCGLDVSCQMTAQGTDVLQLEGMGILNTGKYVRFLVECLQKSGGKLYVDSRVTSMDMDTVYTETGSVRAPYIVVATGYPIINVPGWYFLRLDQREGSVFPLQGTPAFEGILAASDGKFAFCRRNQAAQLRVFGGCVGSKNPPQADTLTQRYTVGMKPLPYSFSGIETFSADGLPFIGTYGRKTPNLFVSTGYGGRGLLGSMTAAHAISAAVLGLPAEGYDVYSAKRQFMAGLPVRSAGRYARSLLLGYKGPFCPHMGCRMQYDHRMKIWKCPCHGSRFDDIGRWLNGPSVHDATIRRRK